MLIALTQRKSSHKSADFVPFVSNTAFESSIAARTKFLAARKGRGFVAAHNYASSAI